MQCPSGGSSKQCEGGQLDAILLAIWAALANLNAQIIGTLGIPATPRSQKRLVLL